MSCPIDRASLLASVPVWRSTQLTVELLLNCSRQPTRPCTPRSAPAAGRSSVPALRCQPQSNPYQLIWASRSPCAPPPDAEAHRSRCRSRIGISFGVATRPPARCAGGLWFTNLVGSGGGDHRLGQCGAFLGLEQV